MAVKRGPRFKECRRLGVNVCGNPKALDRANAPAFKSKGKKSDYALHLIEKQKVRAYYGILERQLIRYYEKASKKSGKTGEQLIILLECRLDNLVYRLGFASSIRMARQMVSHGHILVDGKKINIASYEVAVGSKIELAEKMRSSKQFKETFLADNKKALPYLERDEQNFCGTLVSVPVRADIPVEINDQLVVEYYSK
jgi:small subunit ribosomal protein S4